MKHTLLLLTLLLSVAPLSAADHSTTPRSDVPDWVMTGIAAVATGSTYRDGRLIEYADRHDGPEGEVGPWQLSPAVFIDLNATHLRNRARVDTAVAERLTRAWLERCYAQTGDWFTAVAIYHTGPDGDRARGRAFAERVHNIGAF